jgi:hypothetical protein
MKAQAARARGRVASGTLQPRRAAGIQPLGSCSRGNGRSSPTDRRGMRLCESPVGRRERAERVGPPHRMLRRFLEAVNDDRDLERCLCGKCLYSDVRLVE